MFFETFKLILASKSAEAQLRITEQGFAKLRPQGAIWMSDSESQILC